jgi:hypothetical protein
MRERFVIWFQKHYPGMSLDGPTATGEFVVWAAAYIEGMNRTIEIYNEKKPDDGEFTVPLGAHQ